MGRSSIAAGIAAFALSAVVASAGTPALAPVAAPAPAAPAPAAPAPAAPAPATFKPTVNDVRICLGVDGSTPKQQVDMCTKILATGRVKAPYTGDYYATRAAAYFALNKLDLALADLNKALAIRQSPEFYFQRALVYISRHNSDAANQDLAQVIRQKPDFTPTYLVRGIVAYRAGDYARALTDFDAAVKRVPTYYQALFARGVTKKKTGDEAGGTQDIASARGMSPAVDDDLKRFGITP